MWGKVWGTVWGMDPKGHGATPPMWCASQRVGAEHKAEEGWE